MLEDLLAEMPAIFPKSLIRRQAPMYGYEA
jgi:hypothetical protein